MEFLLPNEIARLVYGYLEDEGCASAAKMFLETSSQLKECMHSAVKGRRFNTKVLGLGLIEMLDLLAEVTCYVKSIERDARKNKISLGDILNQLKLTLKLGNNEEKVEKPVYLRITMPSQSKRKSTPSEASSLPKVVHDSSELPVDDIPESPVVPNQSHALQVLLEKKALHEKLAENINKVVANKCDADSLEKILEKKIVETIVNATEKDPIFQEMLEELVGPIEATNSTPEDTEIENEEAAGQQQSGVEVSQRTPLSFINVVDTSMGSSVIASGVAAATSRQELPMSAVLPQPGHLPLSMSPLVNALSYQPLMSPGVGCGSQTVPGTPVPSLSSQHGAHPVQSYVVTSAPGKATLNSAMPPSPGGVPSRSSLPGSTVTPSVVPSKPTSRYRPILSKQPVKSSIRVLHPTTHQLMTAADVMKVPPNQGSVLQGLLHRASGSASKTPNVTKVLSLKAISPDASLPESTLLKLKPSQPGSTSLIRLGGARTRGGKARTPKTYTGPRKDLKPPNPPTPIHSTPSEVMNSEAVKVSVPDLSTPDLSSQVLSERVDSVIDSVYGECKKVESVPENVSTLSETVEPVREIVSVGLTDKEGAESNTSKAEVSNVQNKAETSVAPERPDATPQQGTEPKVKLRKRLSLSTPRKGSHVRTLEFKTPPKGSSMPRKSMSSPKNKTLNRLPQMHKMLQSVKKSELFKSPPKKEDRSWDADLRSAVNDPCDDIPTSVGLKRKEPDLAKTPKKSSPTEMDALPKPEFSPKTPESIGKSETNEDLVTRIRRDVLDVIDEEDLTDVNTNNKSSDSIDSPKTKSPVKSPSTGSLLEIGDIGVPPSTIKKLYPKRPHGDENSSTLDSPISKVPKETFFVSPSRSQTSSLGVKTPSKIAKSPERSLPNTPCSASLEATLIRECSRIESEGMERARVGSVFGSHEDLTFGEKSIESSNPEKSPEEGVDGDTSILPPPKGILVLKTPAKSSMTLPVEMTPLSKIINEETRLGKCRLLTPTIPPTPDYHDSKNQDSSKTEEKFSPSPSSISDKSPSKESVKVTRKSPKTPTKTPHVRLKTKDPKPPPSRTKSTKKKGKPSAIDCNQLIAQCLQSVKESVFGDIIPDSEDDRSQSTCYTKKKSPTITKKPLPKKKKLSDKKKNKVDGEPKIAEESPKVNIILPSFAEMIERYERGIDPGSSSSDDSEAPKLKSNKSEPVSISELPKNICQPDSSEKSKCYKGDDSVVLSNDRVTVDQNIKLVETEKPVEINNGSKVYEILSPAASPQNAGGDSTQKPDEKVDLDTFTMNCAWLTDEGTVNTVLRTSPFLDIYSYPPVDKLIKPLIECTKSTDSSSRLLVSTDNSNRGETSERSRRRRRSESGSGEGGESNDWKRRRLERAYDSTTPRSPRQRVVPKGVRGRRGGYAPELRDRRSGWRDSWRRPSRHESESSNEGKRHRSKSSGRRTSSYSRDRSRSRPGSECDDGRSPDRSRSGKRREEVFHSSRKDRSRERERTPIGESRRHDRSPRESQYRKNSRQEIKVERLRQEVSGERSRLKEFKAERTRQDANAERLLQDVPLSSHPGKREPPPPLKEKFKFERPQKRHELEEGEISDTSRSTTFSFSKKTSHHEDMNAARLSSPAADENRQALLQRVDLDQFLSLVHGEDKVPLCEWNPPVP